MEPNNLNPQPKSSFFPSFLAILLVFGVSAGTYYYVSNSKNSSGMNDRPPTISISTPKYQGLIQGDVVCNLPVSMYGFTDSQVSSYVKPAPDSDGNWYDLKQGAHFYHSGEAVSVQKIIDSIVPVSGNKIFILHYLASDTNELKQFEAFPGLNGQINITASSVIPANEGIIILACKDSKIYKFKDEITPGSALPQILATKTKGWILLPAKSGETLQASLLPLKDKITAIWPAQVAGFDNDTFTKKFSSVEETGLARKDNFQLVWLKFAVPAVVVPPATDAIPNINLKVEAPTGDLHANTSEQFFKLEFTSDKEVSVKKIDLQTTSTSPGLITDIEKIELMEGATVLHSVDLANNTTGAASLEFSSDTGTRLKIPADNVPKILTLNLKFKSSAADGGKHKLEITNIEYFNITVDKDHPNPTKFSPANLTSSLSSGERTVSSNKNAVFGLACNMETDNKSVSQVDEIPLATMYIASGESNLSIEKITLTYKDAVNKATTDIKVYKSETVESCKDTTGWTAVSTSSITSGTTKLAIELPANAVKITKSETPPKPLYLKITGKIPADATVGSIYNLGIASAADIKTFEPNIIMNLFGTTLPVYGPVYTVAATPAPSVPYDVAVTHITSNSAKVSWSYPDNPAPKSYKISFKAAACNTTATVTTAMSTNKFLDLKPIISKTPYSVTVAAEGASGTFSPESSCRDFTTYDTTAEIIPLVKTVASTATCPADWITLKTLNANSETQQCLDQPYQCPAKYICRDGTYLCFDGFKCEGTATCKDTDGKDIAPVYITDLSSTSFVCPSGIFTCTSKLSCNGPTNGCVGTSSCIVPES